MKIFECVGDGLATLLTLLLVNCTFFSKNPDLSMEEEEEDN